MKAKRKSSATETLYTANRLALLAKVDRRFVERRLVAVAPAKCEGNSRYYGLADALPALCREPHNAESERRILDSRDRESKARAQSAEIQAARDAGEVSMLNDDSAYWRDGFAKMMRVIQSATYLPSKDRVRLTKEMRAIRLDESDGE